MSTLGLLTLFSFSSVASAATLTATSSTDLEAALAAAVDGDTIVLSPGRYAPVQISGTRSLTLRAASSNATSLAGIRVDSGAQVRIEDLTFTAASRAVTVETAALTLVNVIFTDVGSPTEGWAILAEGSGAQLSLEDVTFSGVRSLAGAVQIRSGVVATVTDTTFSDCTGGGALAIYGGVVAVRDTDFDDNAGRDGGAILADGGRVSLEQVSFTRNDAERGGAIFLDGGAQLAATDVVWSGGEATTGGHIFVADGDATLTRAGFSEGRADYGASIAAIGGTVAITNAAWVHNYADVGGAILVDGGAASVAYSVFYSNEASVGAALAMASGSTSLSRSILTANKGAEALANTSSSDIQVDSALFWDNEDLWVGGVSAADVEESAPRFTDVRSGNFTLKAGSPGLDFAVGADLDGTPADLGMFGGPDAWALPDADGDGFVYGRDCNDADETVHEAAVDLWYDGIDSNCDEVNDFDQDGDGYGLEDCNDVDPDIHPGQSDIDDGVDANCDGFDLSDADGDGWPENQDCNDGDASIAPDAADDWYDGIDSNCAGDSDYDQDGDGHDSVFFGGDDCDDKNAVANPDVPEVPDDGIDQDCDGEDLKTVVDSGDGDGSTEVPGEDPYADDDPAEVPHFVAHPEDGIKGTLSCSSATSRAVPRSAWGLLLGMLGVTVLRRRPGAAPTRR